MATDRRLLLKAAAALAIGIPLRVFAGHGTQRLLSCRSNTAGEHFATLFDSTGRVISNPRLPARGHGFAVSHDRRSAVVFARRPGEFMQLLSLPEGRPAATLHAAPGRHFYGHGVFSVDDRLLYATENDYATGNGRIGVYDTTDGYRRIGELDSLGIGPHELRLLSDGRTLVVANGGIRTHPDTPRAKLNLDTMRASLTFLDAADGRLRAQYPTPLQWQRLSIRHIDIAADDRVALVMQYEGPRSDRPPLVALARRDAAVQWLEAPPEVQRRMRNYCGSVAFYADGSGFAVSSPRGGLVTCWSADGRFVDAFDQDDVCGLAASGDELWCSDGRGRLSVGRIGDSRRAQSFDDSHWDNHLAVL